MTTVASLLVAASALVLAGCGGGGSQEADYTKPATEGCLASVGETSDSLDAIGENASGGAVRVEVNGKEVMVVFGRDASEARDIEDQYEPFGGVIDREGNAVVSWTDEPTDEERQAVRECLA